MAYVEDWTCHRCGEPQHSARSDICWDCEKKEKDRQRREHFGALDALTIEERLRKVEEWQYEHTHEGLAREDGLFGW